MPIGDCDPEEHMLADEIAELQKVFSSFDKDGSGSVSATEMQPIFAAVGIAMKPHQISAIVREYDLDKSGEIDFEEFVTMMIKLMGRSIRCDSINYRNYLTEEMIQRYEIAFRNADESGDGELGKDEIHKMVKNMGINLSKAQVAAIFTEVDKDQSGSVEFDEYCAMMVKLTGVRKRINAREYIDKCDIDEYFRIFSTFDTSGDGSISTKELDALLRKMGIILRIDQVDALVQKYDGDMSGELDFEEFLSIMCDLKKLRLKRKINPDTCTAESLRLEGFSATEVKKSGFSAQMMREGKFSPAQVHSVFRTLEMRHAGYSATEMRKTNAGAASLKRVGYSATQLRNAGFSSRAIAAMNKNLYFKPRDVPNFSERMQKTAPNMPGQSTPRIRHFANDVVKVSAGLTKRSRTLSADGRPSTAPESGSFDSDDPGSSPVVGLMSRQQTGRLTALRADLGLTKMVKQVTVR
jgi:Ca2+-binding EF-hand superfamily protein